MREREIQDQPNQLGGKNLCDTAQCMLFHCESGHTFYVRAYGRLTVWSSMFLFFGPALRFCYKQGFATGQSLFQLNTTVLEISFTILQG